MKKYFNSLRPFEKRVVVCVGLALFLVLNLWIVFPHFSDLKAVEQRRIDALVKQARYEQAIAQVPIYNGRIHQLSNEGSGGDVPTEERGTEVLRAVNQEVARSGVTLLNSGRISTRTNNTYFVELSQTVSVQSGEPQLVDFLYNLGSGPSLIRVRALSLHPDPPRVQLSANVTLVASYQKTATAAKPAAKR